MMRGLTDTTTESRLLKSAIDLYGCYGTKAVPLLQIRKHAKVANCSAIRYYFLDKDGLIRHCIKYVAEQIIPPLTRLVEQLEGLEGALTPKMVLTKMNLLIENIFEVYPASVRFLSTLFRDFESEQYKYLVKIFSAVLIRCERLYAKCMPTKAPDLLRIHFILSVNHISYSIVDRDRLASMSWLIKSEFEIGKRTEILSEANLVYILAGVSSS